MATLKRRALSALMALVLVLGLLPGGVLAYEGETDGSGTATITVVDEAGEPLEGITVSLYDRDSGDDSWSEEPVKMTARAILPRLLPPTAKTITPP